MKIDGYKSFLDWGTEQGRYGNAGSRHITMKRAFSALPFNGVVIELGTTRSFVHGGLEGCNSDDAKYWDETDPSKWDWGAGCFTRMIAEETCDKQVMIHTVDICASHINRCKLITRKFSNIQYHVCDSVSFLSNFVGQANLIYIDTGDMTPIEPTALHQLEEVKTIVNKNMIPIDGYILIDDVRNSTPGKYGDTTGLGKAKYSLKYLEENGFIRVIDEYQILLRRVK